jgi:hypothetical protein
MRHRQPRSSRPEGPSAGSDSAAEAHFSNAGSAMNEGTAKIRAATADIQAATG